MDFFFKKIPQKFVSSKKSVTFATAFRETHLFVKGFMRQ